MTPSPPSASDRITVLHAAAPAKINLDLEILGRRPDGYHTLRSSVALISLYDRLRLALEPSDAVRVETITDAPALAADRDNLATRAAWAFFAAAEAYRLPARHLRIAIRKAIPIGAGLGGGSSDAATVLLQLNRYFGMPLDGTTLLTVAANLGADVPLFVRGRASTIGGIGETLLATDDSPPVPLLVAFDFHPLSTPEVFRAFDALPPSQRNVGSNHLETAAVKLHPGVALLLRRVHAVGGREVRMTGSGAAVFGVFDSFAHAVRAAKSLRAAGIWARPVYTLGNSFVSL